jgi:hypothetical protein
MRNVLRLSVARLARLLGSYALPLVVASGALLGGCGDGNSSAPIPGSGGSGGGGNVAKLTQAMNFTYTSKLEIPSIKTVAGEDITISWKDLKTDIQGHAITSDDIEDVVFLTAKNGDHTAVAESLNNGTFGQNSLSSAVPPFEFRPTGGETSATLKDFVGSDGTTPNPATDYVVNSQVTYMLEFQSGTQLGHNSRSLLFLVPEDGNTTQEVAPPDDSSTMLKNFSATMSTTRLPVSAGNVLDWSAVKTDGLGLEIVRDDIDLIHLGFWEGADVAHLEDTFLNLEQPKADGGPDLSWELKDVSGTLANLSDLRGRNGEGNFTSFDTGGKEGTWLLAMFCVLNCTTPAPRVLAVLDPQ